MIEALLITAWLLVNVLAILVVARFTATGGFCRVRGHDWECGLGLCLDCGAPNPDEPT